MSFLSILFRLAFALLIAACRISIFPPGAAARRCRGVAITWRFWSCCHRCSWERVVAAPAGPVPACA